MKRHRLIIRRMIDEWRIWHVVRTTVKANREKFNKIGFDIDWIGRVWTIVNIPDEIMGAPIRNRKDLVMQNIEIDEYIKSSLDDITGLFTDLCLSDLIIYPENYERFKGTDSMLLVFCPDRKYTKPGFVILYFLILALLITGIVIGLKYIIPFLISL